MSCLTNRGQGGFDLSAMVIPGRRDHGLPDYNQYGREWLFPVAAFTQQMSLPAYTLRSHSKRSTEDSRMTDFSLARSRKNGPSLAWHSQLQPHTTWFRPLRLAW
jgi:hypothetical protein